MIDLQGLLGAVAVLLGGLDDAVADRRQGAVPEALAGVLLHGPQRVLGVLLGLVLVEQRHDLADHVAHGVVAELLGDRRQPHAVLGEPPDVHGERLQLFDRVFALEDGKRACNPAYYYFHASGIGAEMLWPSYEQVLALHKDFAFGSLSERMEKSGRLIINEHAVHALQDLIADAWAAMDKYQERLAQARKAARMPQACEIEFCARKPRGFCIRVVRSVRTNAKRQWRQWVSGAAHADANAVKAPGKAGVSALPGGQR